MLNQQTCLKLMTQKITAYYFVNENYQNDSENRKKILMGRETVEKEGHRTVLF